MIGGEGRGRDADVVVVVGDGVGGVLTTTYCLSI